MRRDWTMEEIDFIKRSSDLSDMEIALSLNRSYCSVHEAKKRFGIKKLKHWTKEEEEILIKMIKDGYTIKKIAIKLGRSHSSIENHVHKLRETDKGLKRKTFYKHWTSWTNEEVEYLISNYHNTLTRTISDKLKRSPGSIRCKACFLALKKDTEFLKKSKNKCFNEW